MSTINYFASLLLLLGLSVSACQRIPTESLTRVLPSPSSPDSAITASTDQNQPTQSLSHPVFSEILPELQAQTELPIHLPTYIPESDGPNPIYALLETANASEYQILLAFTEDCTGGTACRLGSVSAEVVTAQSPSLTGEAMALSNELTGYFIDATCGANCSDATLTWEQDSVRYTVAIQAGKVETLVKMANSTISQAQANSGVLPWQ